MPGMTPSTVLIHQVMNDISFLHDGLSMTLMEHTQKSTSCQWLLTCLIFVLYITGTGRGTSHVSSSVLPYLAWSGFREVHIEVFEGHQCLDKITLWFGTSFWACKIYLKIEKEKTHANVESGLVALTQWRDHVQDPAQKFLWTLLPKFIYTKCIYQAICAYTWAPDQSDWVVDLKIHFSIKFKMLNF